MKIGPKFKKLSMFKGQFYMYSISEVFIVEWDYILKHVLILNTSHDTSVPSFLYDHTKSALSHTPLPSNPSWSIVTYSFSRADLVL